MTSENGVMYMPVAPAYGAGNAGGNYGMDGIGGIWGLLILLILFGRGGYGFGGGNGGGQPIVINDSGNGVQRGFDQAAVIGGINGVQSAVNTGFGALQASQCNGFAQAEIAANGRQMANMQQAFDLQSRFQDCCCENRLATQGVQTAIAQEGATTRAAGASDTQKIMDKLCQLELDGVRRDYEGQIRGITQNYDNRIAALENALAQVRSDNQSLRFAASQGNQTATILANNEAQTNALEQYLAPVPRPAYLVQNPNCCGQGFGYGGCGNYAAA